jgi:hypothetical protein
MPDWSADGTSLLYVQPATIAAWDQDGAAGPSSPRNDDDHVSGGSLYTVPYLGNGAFGTPALFLASGGENNYYPTYSPDVPTSFVLFDRAPLDTSLGTLTGCSGGSCPNDSFSNPAARLMLVRNVAGSTAIDLENANGAPATAPVPLSNSYPRWTPFVQTYKAQKIMWFTFSSTRDYGLRLLNHKPGMRQCYPADAYETPGAPHNQAFDTQCRQPQLWLSAINLSDAQGNVDPSRVAFWIPYQDITTHNHMAQWTQQTPPPATQIDGGGGCVCSMLGGPCGAANPCGCCTDLVCSGIQQCTAGPH